MGDYLLLLYFKLTPACVIPILSLCLSLSLVHT